jgi:hypothetical protein
VRPNSGTRLAAQVNDNAIMAGSRHRSHGAVCFARRHIGANFDAGHPKRLNVAAM